MKVLVDYTNNKGERALREIEPWQSFGPTQFILAFDFIPIEGDDDRKFEKTLVMHVAMLDRNRARRTLRADHIHGFKIEKA